MSERPNVIAAYIHCKSCGAKERPRLAIGFTADGAAAQVWCERCDQHVAMLKLNEPVGRLICDECGQPLGPEHSH